MIGYDDPVQTFDLAEGCAVDHVAIYPNDTPDEPPYQAVPFVHRETFEDGQKWYDEPDHFTPTDAYREAVAEHAEMDISEIQLTREIPTFGFDPA